jgi:hypothetical protein
MMEERKLDVYYDSTGLIKVNSNICEGVTNIGLRQEQEVLMLWKYSVPHIIHYTFLNIISWDPYLSLMMLFVCLFIVIIICIYDANT